MRSLSAVLFFALLAPAKAADEPKADVSNAPKATAAAAAPTAAKPIAAAPKSALNNENDKTFYALGMALGGQLGSFSLTPSEEKLVEMGLRDAALGRNPQVPLQIYGPKIEEILQARMEKKVQQEKVKSKAFLEKASKEPGAVKTESGLIYTEIKAGTGESPKATDKVKVHYQGTLTNGKIFDSSLRRGQPAEFILNQVVPCWTEGVQKMKVGGKAKLICPSAIAYGDRGEPRAGILGGAALIFEVELLDIVKQPEPAAAAPAKEAPPATAPAQTPAKPTEPSKP